MGVDSFCSGQGAILPRARPVFQDELAGQGSYNPGMDVDFSPFLEGVVWAFVALTVAVIAWFAVVLLVGSRRRRK